MKNGGLGKGVLKAPFPYRRYFGGKRRISDKVWQRFGDTRNFIDPFFGSGAILWTRPGWSLADGAWADGHNRTETVNDLNGFICNFWRAIATAPDEVAAYADYPVIEQDLHSRHAWLMGERFNLSARLIEDPAFFDAKIAGWWCWGICAWIGAGWCDEKALLKGGGGLRKKLPKIGDGDARGVQGVAARGRQRPELFYLKGVHATRVKRPEVGRRGGKGVHQVSITQGVYPELSKDKGINQIAHRAALSTWFKELSARLRRVRVVCGDWKRITGENVTTRIGITAVFLDPPYSHNERDGSLYAQDSASIATEVREWALANGDNPRFRIALCGYEGEHEMPDTWECLEWKAGGGYGNRAGRRGYTNRHRERIWFSPHCLKIEPEAQPDPTVTLTLFDMEAFNA